MGNLVTVKNNYDNGVCSGFTIYTGTTYNGHPFTIPPSANSIGFHTLPHTFDIGFYSGPLYVFLEHCDNHISPPPNEDPKKQGGFQVVLIDVDCEVCPPNSDAIDCTMVVSFVEDSLTDCNFSVSFVEGSYPTPTPTSTPTPTATETPVPTSTETPTPTPTDTPIPTATETPVTESTSTPTPTSTETPTPTPTNSPTPTPTSSPTPTSTETPTPTSTETPTPTPTSSSTPIPTYTPVPTQTPTPTATETCVDIEFCATEGTAGSEVSYEGCDGNMYTLSVPGGDCVAPPRCVRSNSWVYSNPNNMEPVTLLPGDCAGSPPPQTSTPVPTALPTCVCIEFTNISSGDRAGYYDDCNGIAQTVIIGSYATERVCGDGNGISTSSGKVEYEISGNCIGGNCPDNNDRLEEDPV